METGPRFKVSSERPEKREIDRWIGSSALSSPPLLVQLDLR